MSVGNESVSESVGESVGDEGAMRSIHREQQAQNNETDDASHV